MAYTDTPLTDEQDDVLMMTPKEGAAYEDEGSGSTSGYGDATDDDLVDDNLVDVDSVDEPLDLEDDPLLDEDIDDDDL